MSQNPGRTIDLMSWGQLKNSLGAFYPSMIRVAGAGIQFLITILIGRNLGPVGSSGFFFWSALLMTSAPIASYGLEQLVLRDIPRLQHREGLAGTVPFLTAVRLISLALSVIIGAVFVIYAGVSEGWAPWQILIPVGLAAMSAVIINGEALKGLSHPVLGMFFGHFAPVFLFFVAVLLFSGREGQTSVGMICIWITCFAIGAFLVWFSGKEDLRGPIFAKPDPALLKRLLKEGFPIWLAVMFGALAFTVPLAILRETRPQEEVSFVTTAFRLSILFYVLSTGIHSVFAPAISRAAEAEDPGTLFRAYRKAVALSLVALLPPLLVGIFFPEFVMQVFGEEFKEGASTLRFLLLFNLVTLTLGPVLQLLIMVGRSELLPQIGLAKLAAAIILASLWAPKYGGVGMVLALSIAYLAEELIALLYIIKKFHGKPDDPTDDQRPV